MKQFFTNIAANLATVALLFLLVVVLAFGLVAAAAGDSTPTVPSNALLVVDLSQPLADRPSAQAELGAFDRLLFEPGGATLSLRSAIVALEQAATDDRIAGVLLRGNVVSDGLSSGYAALREFRIAIRQVVDAGKPVHAYLVDPTVRDYYVASAANTITLDPFGSMQFGGLVATQLHFAGLFDKYGIGVQVSRVGKFKAAVEPYTRRDMSPENREQTSRYLEATWREIKQTIAGSRALDTAQLQRLADSVALFLPNEAVTAGLVDRVAHFDIVLNDLQAITGGKKPAALSSGTADADSTDGSASADSTSLAMPAGAAVPNEIPQITLAEYAPIAVVRAQKSTTGERIAIVYAQGEIVNGEGGTNQVGGTAFAREIRALRHNTRVRAVVLRVNSPGGSVTASEEIQRELALLNAEKPVVVSMGTLAASGGYWIATAARRIYAQPNTLTGSIGVFAVFPNVEALAAKQGITTGTVTTARFADAYSIMRPRTTTELELLQRSVDAVYEAFIQRVADARRLSTDSVRTIAEGRVWAGEDALALGLVDELGGLEHAIRYAATLADLDEYRLLEVPAVKGATEMLQELFNNSPPPVVGSVQQSLAARTAPAWLGTAGNEAIRSFARELGALLVMNDPRNSYARLPYALQIR